MAKIKENDYEAEIEFYFNSLKNYKKLTSEQEKELGRRIQNGDKDALNELVERNLRFVVKVAKNYRDRGISFSDIISEGNLGLIHAAKKFDPNKDIKFISYAVWWVRCYINDFIEKQNGTMYVSTDDYSNYQYREDMINDRFEEKLNNINDRKSTIADLLVCLKERERDVIKMSFGLFGETEMNLEEISKVLDLSLERVRQIKDTSLMKIKCEVLSRPTDEFKEIGMLS